MRSSQQVLSLVAGKPNHPASAFLGMVARKRRPIRLVAVTAIVVVVALGAADVEAKQPGSTSPALYAYSTSDSTAIQAASVGIGGFISTLVPMVAAPRAIVALPVALQAVIASSGASVGVTVVELGGAEPAVWSVNGSEVFAAASTYKLAALMLEAQNIAAGKTDPNGFVCYQTDDFERGWFDDYADGSCFTRNELARRAGKYSDNTAGRMLVRDVGGAGALTAWAASVGATSSAFLDGNSTTSADLATLWTAEAQGKLGGAAAQGWLYPLLTKTRTESGVPAGVGGGVTVVHKSGTIDAVDNDAALVTSGPVGPYVLVVMTDGLGGPEGWQLIASISATVSQFEASRSH